MIDKIKKNNPEIDEQTIDFEAHLEEGLSYNENLNKIQQIYPFVLNDSKNKIEKEFSTTKALVEKILEIDERARCDDKWLVIQVLRQLTNIYIPYEDLSKIPSLETITRCRRIIQNKENRFLAPYQTVKNRVLKEIEMKRIVSQ